MYDEATFCSFWPIKYPILLNETVRIVLMSKTARRKPEQDRETDPWYIAHTEHTDLVTIRRLRIVFSGTPPPPPPPYRGPSGGTDLTSRSVYFSAAPAASYL